MVRNEAGEGGGSIVTQRQTYFDDRNARRTLGDEGYTKAKEGELRSLGGPYMSENGQTRLATPEERQLVGDMGQSRFNRIFARQPSSSAVEAAPAQQGASQGDAAGYEDDTGGRRSIGSQMREAFRDSTPSTWRMRRCR